MALAYQKSCLAQWRCVMYFFVHAHVPAILQDSMKNLQVSLIEKKKRVVRASKSVWFSATWASMCYLQYTGNANVLFRLPAKLH